MNKSVAILQLIERSDGMRYTDIQRELWRMSRGDQPFTRANRGYWSTSLTSVNGRDGLLVRFCEKSPDGLWRRNQRPLPDQPWKSTNDGG